MHKSRSTHYPTFLAVIAAACGFGWLVMPSPTASAFEEVEIIGRIVPQPAPAPAAGSTKPSSSETEKPLAPDQVEARFNDDSSLKIKVLDEKVELITPYGKLVIPVSHIQQVELAARLTDEETKRMTQAIGALADEDYEKREAATNVLAEMGEKAYQELLKVSNGDHVEAARRAKGLIDKLREEVSEERLAASGYDVITTAQSRFAGTLTAKTLRVTTTQFGELQLKLADVRELRSGAVTEKEPTDVLPDPGSMSNYISQVGKTFHFRVTGATSQVGSLYGTGTYTYDSNLSVAAVHSGAIKAGETRIVKVKIIGTFPAFTGSTQNGFTSSSYSGYQGYEIVTGKKRK